MPRLSFVLLLVGASAVRTGDFPNPFGNPCATVKCNGVHYWAGHQLTYSNCRLKMVWKNGKQVTGKYEVDDKVVKPSQIYTLGFCPGNKECKLPEGGGYVCQEVCDIYKPPVKKGKGWMAKETWVARTGKAGGPDPPICAFHGAGFRPLDKA